MQDIDVYDLLVGQIYDCAVEPDRWQETLTQLRDTVDAVYISMAHMRFQPSYLQAPPDIHTVTTEWDMTWLERLPAYVSGIPHFDRMLGAALDEPVTQLQLLDEKDFREGTFFKEWLAPQGIRDTCIVNVVRRENTSVVISAPTSLKRKLYDERELDLLGRLGPHLRRAVLISDLFEEQRSWNRIYRDLLDSYSVPVFLVDTGGRVRYHNASAETLVETPSPIQLRNGVLTARLAKQASAFEEAIELACRHGDRMLGSRGNGMVLKSEDGGTLVAYVLPFGQSEYRRALGPGLAAIFIALPESSMPASMEILSAFCGITLAEARVALSLAVGKSTQETADENGISIHTLRKHLANIYEKTGVSNQAALVKLVNSLQIPLN